MSVDGLLNINKPSGITSFQVVARVRRWSGEKWVGHAGTLDPLASGVLPVALGRATRVLEFLLDARKCYLSQLELGKTTDTYDAEGKLTSSQDPSNITQTQVEAALTRFRGTLWQIPPPYSALKYHGKRLYQLARAGLKIEAKPRKVDIFHLEVVAWQMPCLTLDIECSKGTYIRSLAHELGQVLGCGACVKSLLRTRSGPFRLEEAISLQQLEAAFQQGQWPKLLYPSDSVLSHWPAITLDKPSEQAMTKGQILSLPQSLAILPGTTQQPDPAPKDWCRAYSQDGHFLGILHFRHDWQAWHPKKVFL